MGDTCLPWHNAQLDKSETTHLTQAGIEDQRNARATHRSVKIYINILRPWLNEGVLVQSRCLVWQIPGNEQTLLP